ncbi:hypothetical protein, partial [Anabaena sp. CCY 9402-a]|uniref:hypothetical protein n=1 Tax=Anabaena sp. CCY 9402-a TaxID=3103867 RepID=UPI0039C73AE3
RVLGGRMFAHSTTFLGALTCNLIALPCTFVALTRHQVASTCTFVVVKSNLVTFSCTFVAFKLHKSALLSF